MAEGLHNQDSDEVRVEIPQTVHDAVARAERVLDFCRQHVFELHAPLKDHCWHVGQALLYVMRGQLEAAKLYAKTQPSRPVPVMVSFRPIYEAMLNLLYLLRPDSAEERKALGRKFCQFQAWETIEGMSKAPGGIEGFEEQLSNEERPHHSRRKELAAEAEAQFTPEQERQLKRGRWGVTWTGRSIATLAKELEKEQEHTFHRSWYGIMSMATHVSPGMIHWSYKLVESQEESVQHALRCMEHTAEWLARGSVTMFLCSLRFLERYDVELPKEGVELRQELAKVFRSSEDRKKEMSKS